MLPHSLHFNLIKILKLFAILLSGADTRGRTGDLILTKNALCQLSYVGTVGARGGIRTPVATRAPRLQRGAFDRSATLANLWSR